MKNNKKQQNYQKFKKPLVKNTFSKKTINQLSIVPTDG